MSVKTTKSYTKRLKITRNGKLIARKPGQNHFNAKERTRTSSSKHRMQSIYMSNKDRGRFLPNI
jgi:ribosomal protein L35